MRFIAGLCLAALCVFAAVPAAAETYPQTEEGLQNAYDQLNWRSGSGSYKLPKSHAVIRVRSGQTLLLGGDAERYRWLSNGTEHPDTEAVLSYDSSSAKSIVYYTWQGEGYISDADWADVNPDQLLADYREGTEAGNDERIDNGIEPMHVVGWLEKPHYDESTNTVTYAIELKDKDGSWANAFALRLGRAGYTEFIWVGSVGLFQSAGSRPALLNDALAAHSFEGGHRYAELQGGRQGRVLRHRRPGGHGDRRQVRQGHLRRLAEIRDPARARLRRRDLQVRPAPARQRTHSRSRIAYHSIASTISGWRNAVPPGNERCGRLANTSNRSAVPLSASAISLPAMPVTATPWPE